VLEDTKAIDTAVEIVIYNLHPQMSYHLWLRILERETAALKNLSGIYSPGALGLTKEKIPNKLIFSKQLACSTRNNISKLPKNPR